MSSRLSCVGFCVDNFLVKKDKVKLVLVADKDDIGDLGELLKSLEIHSTSEHPVGLTVVSSGSGEQPLLTEPLKTAEVESEDFDGLDDLED